MPPQKKAKPAAAKTAVAKPKTAKAVKGPTPQKSFNDTVKAVAKDVKKLDKDVKKLNPNDKFGIHIDSYIHIATTHAKVVHELAKSDVTRKFPDRVRNAGDNMLILDISRLELDPSFRRCRRSRSRPSLQTVRLRRAREGLC